MAQEPTDEQLARSARTGDLDAFRNLVRRHRTRIYSLALRLVRDRTEAEDMAQEAFLRIYRGLGSFRGESAFTTWMVRVALNTFNRYLKRMPREAPLPVFADDPDHPEEAAGAPAPGPDPEADLLASLQARRLRRLVAALPRPFREAVTLFYLQERSVEEAAAALSISTGTLKSRLFRARARLMKLWRDDAAVAVAPRVGAARESAMAEPPETGA